jgi:serine/threonine-protein kinase RsbW
MSAVTEARTRRVAPPKQLHHVLPSDLDLVDAVCRDARSLLACHGQVDCVFAVDLLLREFLNNAIVHGNRRDRARQVEVTMQLGRDWIVLTIADQGPGFDWRAQRRAPPADDATSGRGLAIGAEFAQRMKFNREGNQVMLWINKDAMKKQGDKVDVEVTRHGQQLRVVLGKKLTAVEVPVLQPALKQELADDVRQIVFDLADTESVDSTGIGLLIAANNSLAGREGELRLLNVSADIMKLLKSMRLVERLNAEAAER